MSLWKWLPIIGSAIALIFSSGGVLAQSGEQPSPSQIAQNGPIVTVPAAPTGPALWLLSDEDTKIYLFGTLHALPSDTNWFDDRIRTAFASSEELVTEINTEDPQKIRRLFLQTAVLEGDKSLRELMKEEDRLEFEAALSAMNIPEGSLDRYEPWFAFFNLSVLSITHAGFDPDTGVEMVLKREGADKAMAALETIEEQIALFDGLPMASQLDLLDETVAGIPEIPASIGEIFDCWIVGDIEGLAMKVAPESSDQSLHRRLLIDRNANWVNWIEDRMKRPGTVFIAVGAGHLAGEGSVQDQLEKRGYTVTRH